MLLGLSVAWRICVLGVKIGGMVKMSHYNKRCRPWKGFYERKHNDCTLFQKCINGMNGSPLDKLYIQHTQGQLQNFNSQNGCGEKELRLILHDESHENAFEAVL
jgi:hypothetical protein